MLVSLLITKLNEDLEPYELSSYAERTKYREKAQNILTLLPSEVYEQTTHQLCCLGFYDDQVTIRTTTIESSPELTSRIIINSITPTYPMFTELLNGCQIDIELNDSTHHTATVKFINNNIVLFDPQIPSGKSVNTGANIIITHPEVYDVTLLASWSTDSDKCFINNSGYMVCRDVDTDTVVTITATIGSVSTNHTFTIKNRT